MSLHINLIHSPESLCDIQPFNLSLRKLLLYNMLEKEFVNGWFTRWAAAAVVVSIPISILFVIMQRFYVDGLTGAVKG